MQFQLTDEQLIFKEAIREFCESYIEPIAIEIDENSRFPEEVFAGLAELGCMGMPLPSCYGGAGLDYLSYIMVLEEIACSSAAISGDLSVHTGAAIVINNFGTEEQKQKYIPSMNSGEKLGAFCLTEPGAGSDVTSITTTAVLDGDSYVINGAKTLITNGPQGGIYLVLAYTDPTKGSRGTSLFIVPRETPGLKVGTHFAKMGVRASQTSDIIFQNCRVPKENLIGQEGQGIKICLTALDNGRIAVAAQSIGMAQAAMNESIKYSKQRVQFGRPIAEKQAIQFMIAEMATDIAAARLLTYQAASLKDQGSDFIQEASMAKLFASVMCNRHVYKAVQIHGGLGYIKGVKVERLMRDARGTEIYEGTTEVQKIIIAERLLA